MNDVKTVTSENELMVSSNPTTLMRTVTDGGTSIIADLTTSSDRYCSIIAQTQADKARVVNLANGSDVEKVADHINTVITVKDLYIEKVQCTDEVTGELLTLPRIIFLTTDGKAYQCVSNGIFIALSKLIGVFGVPTWDEGIKIKLKQVTTKKGHKMLTFEVQ